MASTPKDCVQHWRKKLERTTEESVILNVVHKLSKVPMTVDLLQDTGIGKVIRGLAKKSGKVGEKASAVLNYWRGLVSSQKSPETSSKAVHSKHSSSKSERKEEKDANEKKSHKKISSHEKHSKVKKSFESDGKQNLDGNEDAIKKYVNHTFERVNGSEYNATHRVHNNTSNKNISTIESNSELSFSKSLSGKRKFEALPLETENYIPEPKKVKIDSNCAFNLDSNGCKNGSEKQSNHGSHKKKDKKSHNSGSGNESKNSHAHTSKNSESSSKKSKQNKDKKNHCENKKSLKIKSTEVFTSSEARFEDCLNFSDIAPVHTKKKKSSKNTTDKKEKHKENSSKKDTVLNKLKRNEKHADAHVLKLPTVSTTFSKHQIQEKNCLPPLLSESSQSFLPKVSEVDILSTLPQIQPNYRPLPQRNYDCIPSKNKAMSIEDAIKFTSSRKERTNVYSGKKSVGYTEVPTLFECCTRILIENIDAIEYLGEVPYYLLKPVLERCTAVQLYAIEHYNPYLLEDTHELWERHCQKDFRSQKLQENETWRDLYLRAFEEREEKLKNITANISANISKSNPARQVKLAYVNTVVKPPRDVARKQAKHGTALPVSHNVKAGPPSKASPRPVAPAINSANNPKPDHFIPKKPKVAPLMAKTLKKNLISAPTQCEKLMSTPAQCEKLSTSAQCEKLTSTSVQCEKLMSTYVQCEKIAPTYVQCEKITPTYVQCEKISSTYVQCRKAAFISVQCEKISSTSVQF
ncbi:elongin-A [Nephila pilipes]|uniref:Elongin-A n=1 Tax=Nephila pilipes TaxID=299642 RepID=A0A8X6UJN3_NEPPI|nr:elongin-A [Nephila pilipes]